MFSIRAKLPAVYPYFFRVARHLLVFALVSSPAFAEIWVAEYNGPYKWDLNINTYGGPASPRIFTSPESALSACIAAKQYDSDTFPTPESKITWGAPVFMQAQSNGNYLHAYAASANGTNPLYNPGVYACAAVGIQVAVYSCPDNSHVTVSSTCECDAPYVMSQDQSQCILPPGDSDEINLGAPDGQSCSSVGDPINVAVGNVYEIETDFAGEIGSLPLKIERTYNSMDSGVGLFGQGWRSNLDAKLTISGGAASVSLPSGQRISFLYIPTGQVWINNTSTPYQLTSSATGYTLQRNDKYRYEFNLSGRLLSQVDVSGQALTYQYSGSVLTSVTDHFGNILSLGYNSAGFLSSANVAGQVIQYSYDTAPLSPQLGNLLSVSFPANVGVQATRQYLYENAAYPHALTGLIDQSGNRVATWGYNGQGKAISNSRAGLENFSIDYSHLADASNPYSKVTNGSGYSWKYYVQKGNDKMARVTRIEGLGSASCATSNNYISYDNSGRATMLTDGSGNVTLRRYTYDNFIDQETQGYRWANDIPTGNVADLVETATMKKYSVTQWDTSNKLPAKIVYSGKTIAGVWLQYKTEEIDRDPRGRVKSRTEKETTLLGDPYIAEFQIRQWFYTYTYHDLDQTKILTKVERDPRDNSITTTYDAFGRKTRVEIPLNSSLTLETSYGNFNSAGLAQLVTDPNGVQHQLSYDVRNRLSLVTRNVGAVDAQATTFDYYENGDLKRVTLADGSWLNYTYGNGVHLSRIDDNAGNYILLTPSSLGDQWTQRRVFDNTGALLQTQNRVFDDIGRILQVVSADGATVKSSFTHDGASNLESSRVGTDATTAITRNYDALNRLKKLNTPDGNNSQYQYDAQGNLAKVTDSRGLVTQYIYDGLGNLMKLQSPDTGTTKFWYDIAGNNTKKQDSRGIVSQYTYDALNRLTDIVYPASPAENVSFVYDYDGFEDYSKGRLSYVSDTDGVVIVGAYDAYGNVAAKVDWISTVNSSSEYTYDGANRVVGITYPSGRVVTYIRNALGQITQVQLRDSVAAPPQTLVSGVTYKPFGPLSSLGFGNGVVTTLAFDSDYRVTRITATSTPNWDYSYHYDAADNIDELTDQVSTNDRVYSYDKLNRIMQDNKTPFGAAGLVEYQYDPNSNRTLWKQIVGQAQTYQTTSNRQTQYGASTLLLHDNAGNLTAYGSKVFSYNNANRMSLSVVGSTSTTYRYNGLGQRTTKLATTGGNTVVTHYDYDKDGKYLGQVQLNSDGTFAQGDEYIWLDDMPIAQVHTVYGVNNVIASQKLTYIHADHLNTPRAMTDATKKIVWKWESEVYGRNAPNADPDGDGVSNKLDLRFPGQIADAETGLYYNMNRYYDPMMGRYTQSDPIGLAGGLNTYGYVNGNPMRFSDPTGQNPVLYFGAGVLGYGLYEGYQYCKNAFSTSSDAQQKNLQSEAALDAMMAGRPYNPSDIEAANNANKEVINSALDVINHLPPGTTATPFDSVRDRRRK